MVQKREKDIMYCACVKKSIVNTFVSMIISHLKGDAGVGVGVGVSHSEGVMVIQEGCHALQK